MIFTLVSQFRNVLVLQIKELDYERQPAAAVGDEMRAIVDRSPVPWILVDLMNIDFMTSAFIGQLILLKKRCDNNRLTLKLCSVTPSQREVLKLVRFDELVEIFENRQDAIESFESADQDALRIDLIDGTAADFIADASAGKPEAQYMLGLCLESGQGIEQDIQKATDWIARAASAGYAPAQYKLGIAHAFGVGLNQNFNEAKTWFQRAAEQDLADAQYMMGLSLQHGIGSQPDERQALKWYQMAAQQGHVQAKKALQAFELPSS